MTAHPLPFIWNDGKEDLGKKERPRRVAPRSRTATPGMAGPLEVISRPAILTNYNLKTFPKSDE
jgi:hypothetical protein